MTPEEVKEIYLGSSDGAEAQVLVQLQEHPEDPRLWHLLGHIRARSSGVAIGSSNPSGRQESCSPARPKDASDALLRAHQLFLQDWRSSKDLSTTESDMRALAEEIHRLLKLDVGYSPSVVIEGMWCTARSDFILAELPQAAKFHPRKSRVAAVVVDGLGWEAVWLARHRETLGFAAVYSVRMHGQSLLAFERTLADRNPGELVTCTCAELAAHLEMARPDAIVFALAGLIGSFPVGTSSLWSTLLQLHAAAPSTCAVQFVPPVLEWQGGVASGSNLRMRCRLRPHLFEEYDLDYTHAAQELRPSYFMVDLMGGREVPNAACIASLHLADAWRILSTSSGDEGVQALESCLSVGDARSNGTTTETISHDAAFVWWTTAKGRVAGSSVSCGPCEASQSRAWQVAVPAEHPLLHNCSTSGVVKLLSVTEASGRYRAYHIPMLNDVRRTEWYAEALRQAVTEWPEGRALVGIDLGAGTGLLSMLLARQAQGQQVDLRVAAVEAEAGLASLATKLLQANGLGDVVHVVNAMSTSLQAMPGGTGRANLCVHEVFGSDPLSEMVLPTLRHARLNLLSPQVVLVPRGFTLMCRLCQGDCFVRWFKPPVSMHGVREVHTAFAAAAPVAEAAPELLQAIDASTFRWLSEPVVVGEFDLLRLIDEVPLEKEIHILGEGNMGTVTESGLLVAFWFRLEGSCAMDTGKGPAPTGIPWAPVLQSLQRPLIDAVFDMDVLKGPYVATLQVRLSDDRTRFALKSVAMQDELEKVSLDGLFDGL